MVIVSSTAPQVELVSRRLSLHIGVADIASSIENHVATVAAGVVVRSEVGGAHAHARCGACPGNDSPSLGVRVREQTGKAGE